MLSPDLPIQGSPPVRSFRPKENLFEDPALSAEPRNRDSGSFFAPYTSEVTADKVPRVSKTGKGGKPMKRLAYVATTLCVSVLLAFTTSAVAQEEEPVQDEVVVSIQDGYFDPADIVVAPGTTVWWVNEGNYPHNVTADNGLFDSGPLYPGDSFWVTFEGQGTVTYHCSPQMAGSVTVT
jgi:plastocyanin